MKPALTSTAAPRLVIVDADDQLRGFLSSLASALAHSAAADFNEAVLLVKVVPDAVPITPVSVPAGQVTRIELPAGTDPVVTIGNLMARWESQVDLLVLDLSRFSRPAADAISSRIGIEISSLLFGRLVYVTRSGKVPAPLAGFSVLRTDLGAPEPQRTGLAGRSARDSVATVRRFFKNGYDSLGGQAIEPSGQPYPMERETPEWCRLRVELADLVGPLPPSAARTSASLSRWARAVTHRRVGVALGGSGSWGFAHVALLDELARRGVPTDLVGGASSGALMGAYFAVLGQPGLDLLIQRGPLMSQLVWLAMVSTTAIQAFVDIDLENAMLDDLETLYFPVALNLSRARAEYIAGSTVGAGVRASGSAPGLFGATVTRTGTYVDGAVVDNVPIVLLERMGADLVIACNPLPPPAPDQTANPVTRLGDFLVELNPMNRLRLLGQSFGVMLHQFGRSEPSVSRIVYDPPPHAFPLRRTFRFDLACEIIASVKSEPKFQEVLEKSSRAWQRLAQPGRAR